MTNDERAWIQSLKEEKEEEFRLAKQRRLLNKKQREFVKRGVGKWLVRLAYRIEMNDRYKRALKAYNQIMQADEPPVYSRQKRRRGVLP